MLVWQRINESLAVVAWPVVVLVVVVVYRDVLRNLISRAKSVEVMGNTVRLEHEVTRQANEALAPAQAHGGRAANAAKAGGEDHVAETPPPEGSGTGQTTVRGAGRGEAPRFPTVDAPPTAASPAPAPQDGLERAAVEEVARTFARAGWQLGASGEYAGAPSPTLEWTSDGGLRLTGWAGGSKATAAAPRGGRTVHEQAVARLEQVIRELDTKVKSRSLAEHLGAGGLGGIDARGDAEAEQLQEFRERLAELDPTSPWAAW